ncbi:MAG: DUF4440 domain-containing protein [Pyrinomonadaceae bacterium]
MKLAIIILLAAASVSFAQSNSQKAQIEVEVLAVLTRQSHDWNRGDVEGFMSGYWNSPDLVFASGDKVTKGWQATLDNYKKTYNSKAAMGTLSFTDLEINVLSREICVAVGSWSLKRESDNPKGKFTLIFRKFKEGWRIIHDHTS